MVLNAPEMNRPDNEDLAQMTHRISHPLLAMALALGMIAAFSSPGRAALSTAERTSVPVAAGPETTTLAATAEAAPVAATAPVAEKPRKRIVRKATPRRLATAVPRAGYPCH